MRRVLANTHEVYHYWANQTQSRGECGNVSFRDSMAFSYARCIAKIHTRNDGKKLVIFGTHGYDSPTTAKHQSFCRSAASHLKSVHVPLVDPIGAGEHLTNLQGILGDVAHAQAKAARARQNKDMWTRQAASRADDYNTYAEFFGLASRYSETAIEELKKAQAKAEKAAAARRRLEAKKRLERVQAQLAEWRAGQHYSLYDLPYVALRLKGEQIETSRGAAIPVGQARKLWRLVTGCRKKQAEFTTPVMVGVYRLSKVRADGSMVVGCHDIPFTEIEGIAHQLGLTDTSQSLRAFEGKEL